MKAIEFRWTKQGSPTNLLYTTYGTKDLSGRYYPADPVDKRIAELEAKVQQVGADWVERCRKFRKQDAEQVDALVAAASKLVWNSDDSLETRKIVQQILRILRR